MGIYGQDWASYQTTEPSVAGLDFVIVKVTEGLGYINPKWARQRDHIKRNGLVWGAYHYPHMGSDPKVEADYFLRQVDWQPGDVIVLDWEGYDTANASVSKTRQLAYKETWLRYVKAKMPGHRVGMYCNVDYWRNVDTTGYCGDFLWIATAGRAAGDPGIKSSWMFHQYGDNPVDKDYCPLSSREELRAWALSTTLQEDTMPEPIDLWAYRNAADEAEARKASGGKAGVPDAYGYLVGTYRTVAAMSATVATLAKALGDAHPDVDTATLVAAVQKAIADAVIHVDVNVTGTPTPST